MGKSQNQKLGKWNKTQHDRFMKALQKYGKNWNLIQKVVATRTLAQVRSHAQKLFLSMTKQQLRSFQDQLNCRFESFCNIEKNSQTNSSKRGQNKAIPSENTSPRILQGLPSIQNNQEKFIQNENDTRKQRKGSVLLKQNIQEEAKYNSSAQNQVINKEKNQGTHYPIRDSQDMQCVQNISNHSFVQPTEFDFYVLPVPTFVWITY